jgi:hypothetical protein
MTKKQSGNNEVQSKISVICFIVGIVTIILFYVSGSLYCVPNKCGIEEIGLGEIGDFVNPIIAALALMLLYLTYYMQKIEIKKMGDQLDKQKEKLDNQLELAKLDNQIQAFTHFSSLSEKHMDTMLYQIISYSRMETTVINQNQQAMRDKKAYQSEIDKFNPPIINDSVGASSLKINKDKLKNCCDSYLKVYESLLEKARELDNNIEYITKKKSNYILLYNSFSFAEIKENIDKFNNFLGSNELADIFKRLK